MVSLRGGTLKLLALRGHLVVDGTPMSQTVLVPGQVISLARSLELIVVDVTMPHSVPAIEGVNLPRQILPPVASLVDGKLVAGFVSDADALLWNDGGGLYLRLPGESDRVLALGDEVMTRSGETFVIVEVKLSAAGVPDTTSPPALRPALVLVIRFDVVHVRQGEHIVPIDGLAARLVTELAQMRVPVDWRTLARELWSDESDDDALRGRLDGVLGRLRKRLRDAGLPLDLVRSDGRGHLELMLGPRDRIKDET